MDPSGSEVSSKKSFKCTNPSCFASFSRKYKLVVHLRKHTGERPFVCDEEGCAKAYTNNSHLCRHKNVVHGEKKSQSILCSYEGCGVVFANKYSLKKHYNRKHRSDKKYPFQCYDCNQGFERKKHLQNHVYVHTGEASHSCDKCNLSFKTSYKLRKHQRNHQEYTCDCGEILHRWTLFLAHKKLCRPPRFMCTVCGKTFSHLGNYKSHKLVHRGDSKQLVFTCPIEKCERFYFYKKNLKWHIQTFHKVCKEQQIFRCTYPNCSVVLKTKVLQRRHFQRHFQLTVTKPRAQRHDAGVPKKPIAATLIGKNLMTSVEEENTLKEITDQELFDQCDKTLKLIQKQMVTAL